MQYFIPSLTVDLKVIEKSSGQLSELSIFRVKFSCDNLDIFFITLLYSIIVSKLSSSLYNILSKLSPIIFLGS